MRSKRTNRAAGSYYVMSLDGRHRDGAVPMAYPLDADPNEIAIAVFPQHQFRANDLPLLRDDLSRAGLRTSSASSFDSA